MKSNFARISRSTENEMEVEDLHQDAWVIALDMGDRRGRPIDFSDPADQDLVMRAVNLQNVRRGDWQMRRAVRIDQEPEAEKGTRWADRLPAQASSDPLVSLLASEAASDPATLVEKSHSQGAAYLVTFDDFHNDRQRVCAHLVISEGALWRRVSDAAMTYRRQPSVFDGKERIPASFLPLRWRQFGAKAEDKREAGQWAWDFS